MQYPTKALILVTSLIVLSFTACAPTLKEYQPNSPDEEAIKNVLLVWESSWNNRDQSGVLSVFHDKAQMKYGPERNIASKKEYAEILSQRFKAVGTMKLGAPKISIAGDKADVSFPIQTARFPQYQTTFHMVREDNKWLIMGETY